ncbi:TnpV protein [Pseudoflavonifractor sp. MSJ-30]|uniref:TnpV protein n=1 Tax=Pseudoflavonifractor sp. MSJ-30 TaxID=2841525 RepID=UPI00209E56D4|nr:TnpV protein [Pseudoflavonifractor sp. MSJ-30]
MELAYTMQGDYLIPDLTVPESPKLGKYGMLRRTFLREHRDGIYTGMLLNGTLNGHLEEVDRQAQKMLDDLTEQMKALNGVTEQLKAEDQMQWVQMMNSIRHSAEEVILNDLIYA